MGVGAVLAAPLVCFAQQEQNVRRIGFLSPDAADSWIAVQVRKWLPEGLSKLGYIEGKNLIIEWRFANGNVADLPALAADLISSKVELIVAKNNSGIRAAMQATKDIPIVMWSAVFPVEAGFVASLARPGGNVTGVSYTSGDSTGKIIEILKELAPKTDHVAFLRNQNDAARPAYRAGEEALARIMATLGMTPHYFDVRRPEEVAPALDKIAASGIKAMVYYGDPMIRTRVAEIMAFVRDRRVAAVGMDINFAESGGLAQYTPGGNNFGGTARYVDRILKGARPSELAVAEPATYELVINRKTAKLLGLAVPQSLLMRADRVID